MKMRFLNSITVPKNVEGGPFWIFYIHCVAKYRNKRSGDPLVESKKVQKSRIVPKKIQSEKYQRGGLQTPEPRPKQKHRRPEPRKHNMFSRFWTSMFLFWTRFRRFEHVLDVRSSS